MTRILRLAAINLAVLVGLVVLINLGSAIVVGLHKMRAEARGASDPRIAMPSFTDKERAREFFREFYPIQTRYVPYEEWRYEPFAGAAINIDAEGLRRTPVEASATHTIHFFGGSTTWGTGVWDAETIPAQVARLMPGIAAVNHAQSGFVSRQEVNALLSALNDGEHVDGVVFYDGANDVYVLCALGGSVNGHGEEALMREALKRYGNRDWEAIGDMFARGTLDLAELVREKMASGKPPAGGGTDSCARNPDRARRVADTLLGDWATVQTLLAARGIPFLAVLQPLAATGHADTDYLPDRAFMEAEFRAVYPILRARVASSPATMLDLTDALDGTVPYYIDFAHVSAAGNAIIAKRIADRLAQFPAFAGQSQ